jgi:hypothetical protein
MTEVRGTSRKLRVVLETLIVACSGYIASVNIGQLLRSDGMAAWLAYVAPVTWHLVALGALLRVLEDPRTSRRSLRRTLYVGAVLVAVLAALGFQARLGHTNLTGMAIVGLVAALGPLMVALDFLQEPHSRQ